MENSGKIADRTISAAPLYGLAFAALLIVFSWEIGECSDSYHALNSRFVGYTEQETDTARFDIHYSGQWRQSHELVGRYGLFRSAELAQEMGFPAFTVSSFTLDDEPDVQIFETCSDIRVVSNSSVPAASVSVRYLFDNANSSPEIFSVQELIGMKPVLLDDDKDFDLQGYLQSRGVEIIDEREQN